VIALVLTITNTLAFSRCDKFSQASNWLLVPCTGVWPGILRWYLQSAFQALSKVGDGTAATCTGEN
jgi:hypothetical protein